MHYTHCKRDTNRSDQACGPDSAPNEAPFGPACTSGPQADYAAAQGGRFLDAEGDLNVCTVRSGGVMLVQTAPPARALPPGPIISKV